MEVDQQDITGLFKSMDIDGGGEISFDEFLRVVVGEMSQFRRSLVERAYNTLDVNKDGSISVDEFKEKYCANMHPDVRSGKRTEHEVITEFMETFEKHQSMIADKKGKGDGMVTLDEFIEYYNNISCNIENDSYFDLMISNAWQLEGGTNPGSMPYAGVAKKVAQVNAREAYRLDHHRNLFGTDTTTPFEKGTKKVAGQWSTSMKSALGNPETQGQGAAGSQTIHN